MEILDLIAKICFVCFSVMFTVGMGVALFLYLSDCIREWKECRRIDKAYRKHVENECVPNEQIANTNIKKMKGEKENEN